MASASDSKAISTAKKSFGMFWNNTISKLNDPTGADEDFGGKVVVMVAGLTNAGLEAAIKIARLNVEKIIIGIPRFMRRKALRLKIQHLAGRNDDFCYVLNLDMSSFRSV